MLQEAPAPQAFPRFTQVTNGVQRMLLPRFGGRRKHAARTLSRDFWQ
jgi:hypothetical protein